MRAGALAFLQLSHAHFQEQAHVFDLGVKLLHLALQFKPCVNPGGEGWVLVVFAG